MIIVLQNRTIECSMCGRIDMVTSECVADMKDVVESEGWRVCRIVDECELRGICPICKERSA